MNKDNKNNEQLLDKSSRKAVTCAVICFIVFTCLLGNHAIKQREKHVTSHKTTKDTLKTSNDTVNAYKACIQEFQHGKHR